jgi:7,8-dihydropterin-6-yl-methyl-4-(beta-D-ribofuranosyl)aminobenzene 5'-phosphate synthase
MSDKAKPAVKRGRKAAGFVKPFIKEDPMKIIDRREFVKTMAIGGIAAYAASSSFPFGGNGLAYASQGTDFGELKRVKVRCLSETGWWSTPKFLQDIKDSGGMEVSQYKINWTPKNAGGYSALIEAEELDGKVHRFLLDTGWDRGYMDWCFQREGVAERLKKGEIEFLYVSHEHIDHFWGLPVTCKYKPDVKLIIPSTFYPEGHEFIKKSGHKGQVVQLPPNKVHQLFPGCASMTFDIPIILGVKGEQVLFFNIKKRGLVIVTGCCHPMIHEIIAMADRELKPKAGYFGLYGGLHIALLENWNPKFDVMIDSIQNKKFAKIGSNHCTGLIAVNKMLERKLAVVKGTASYGSKSELYIGNGDEMEFSMLDMSDVG